MLIPIQLCSDEAYLPLYSSLGAAAFDIRSPEKITLIKNDTILIPLGFKMAIPSGFAATLITRSGLGAKKGLSVRNHLGLIDSDYRGEWMAKLTLDNLNDLDLTDEPYITIEKGDKILQAFIHPVVQVSFESIDSLPETERNEGGFGSTGL